METENVMKKVWGILTVDMRWIPQQTVTEKGKKQAEKEAKKEKREKKKIERQNYVIEIMNASINSSSGWLMLLLLLLLLQLVD